ncbi:MAG: NAD(P)H-dependent oxidoreductase [Solirubrobacterales bacterium]|nr:NAD(P)H-dependent oxidoreductase [Solirubrobacterales bacterium]
MHLLGLSGSPTPGAKSKTLIAVRKAIEYAQAAHPEISVDVLSIRDHDMQFCDGREPELYEGDSKAVIDRVVAADALIIGSPMYRGSYPGVLKNVFDLLPNDAMEGKPVGLIATGGTDHHFLALEHELKPVIGFFYAHAIPGGVYANNSHYADGELIDEGILERLRDLAVAVVEFAIQLPGRSLIGPAKPSIPRRSLVEG